MATLDERLAALEREKAGYEMRGLPDRAKLVDQEVARLRKAAAAEAKENAKQEQAETPEG